jgi:hypothetical protein
LHPAFRGEPVSSEFAALKGNHMKLLVYVLLTSGLAFAQTFQGSLRGRVTDPSGAATFGAKIAIADEAKSAIRTTVTNDQGEYVFTAVTPATYTVSAVATGFKRLERKGVVVSTQAAVTVDLALELGQVTEQVNVTEEAPPLQTSDASTGQVIESQKITDLPILGRNPNWRKQSCLSTTRRWAVCRTRTPIPRFRSPAARCEPITFW